ncbi:MAG: hypothetical protein J6D54_04240 [Olsenella sp.]|nr:hypothetical protein [Olsenella sp.]
MRNGPAGAEGRTRVVDRRGKGIAAIGIESFADVVARHVCVDKTMVIADLIDRGGDTWEAMRASAARLVAEEFARHSHLLDSPKMAQFRRDEFERILSGNVPDAELEHSLVFLCKLLRNHHQQQVVVLIDEYDKIVTEGHLHGYRKEATGFLKR